MPTSTGIAGRGAGVALGPGVGSGVGVGTGGDAGFDARRPDCAREILPKTKARLRIIRQDAIVADFAMTSLYGKRSVL